MIKKTTIAVLTLMFISCGKSDIKSELVGKWDFRNVFNPNNEIKKFDEQIGENEIDNLGNESFFGSYYVLNEDNTYYSLHTEGVGGFIEGRWSYNEKDSLLNFNSSNKTQEKQYKINYLENKKLSFSDPNPSKVNSNDSYLKQLSDNSNHRYKFIKDDFTLDSELNFTEKKLNLWRIKPKKSESKKQINNRAKQSLEYSIMFLKNTIEQNKKDVRLNAINLPLNFYSNGVEMKNFEDCYGWKRIFYDDDEALVGFELIKNVMEEKFEIPENKKPIELNLYILEELYKRLPSK